MLPRQSQFCSSSPAGFIHASRSAAKGFSIVELMVSLVLIAIGAALALPSYQNMMEKRQLSRGAEQLLAFVNSAQSRSVQWNERLNVSWTRTGDTDWCVGANLGDTVCDCTVTDINSAAFCDINNDPWIFSDAIVGDRVLLKSFSNADEVDSAFSFEPDRGLFLKANDSLAIDIHSQNDSYQLQLTVSNTGQASLCSKDADHQIPAYKLCASDGEQEEISETAD